MRVLVTGATGLTGRGVVARLLDRGAEVVAVVRPETPAIPGTTTFVHDLRQSLAPDALPPTECLVHLAHHPHVTVPENATALHRLNTSATQELLEAARATSAARFVYASSGAVYGYSDHTLDEEEPAVADDYYALTKLHAEQLVRAYRSFFETTIVRPFFPYGRGQRDRLIPRLADRIVRGEPISVNADERPRVNPIFVDDAVDAIVAAVEGRSPSVLNLAGPDVVSIRELAERIGEAVGRTPVIHARREQRSGDLIGATTRLERVLARPLVPLEEGLRAALTPERSYTKGSSGVGSRR